MNFDRPNSADSLANNITGTTFAAKARAAELNAARASKALAAEHKEEPARMESVKLFKPRAKAKTWRPLDLSNLDSQLSGDEQNMDVQAGPSNGDNETSWQASYVKHLSEGAKALSDLGQNEFPKLGDTSLNDLGKDVHSNVEDYEEIEWDPDLPTNVSVSEESTVKASAKTSAAITEEQARASIATPLSRPHPIQRSSSASYGYRPSFEAAMQKSLLEDVFDNNNNGPTAQTTTSHPNPSFYGNSTSQMGDDPFLTTQSFPNYCAYSATQKAKELAANQPRRLGMHQYPAVKGTMNPNFQFPARPPLFNPLGHVPSMPTNSANYAKLPPGLALPAVAGTINNNIAKMLPEPYRRPSSDEKKAQLKYHLESLLDGPATASRTVLHDPVAHATPQRDAFERITNEPITTSPTAELVADSDELAWRDRPVTIYGNVNGNTVPTFAQMQPRLDRSLADAKAWFDTDNRVTDANAEAIQNWLMNTRKEVRPTNDPEKRAASQLVDQTLVQVIANLSSYSDVSERDYFSKYGRVPDWCIDQAPSGNRSFFGKDWGVPPKRVGRDARYRPVMQDGRYTIFEDLPGTPQISGVRVGGVGAVGGDR